MKPPTHGPPDPHCPKCHGIGAVTVERDGVFRRERCDCAIKNSVKKSWENWVPGCDWENPSIDAIEKLNWENLSIDEHNHTAIEKLSGLMYDPLSGARGALLKGQPGRGKTWIAAATLRGMAVEKPFPTSQYIFWDEFLDDAHEIKMSEHPNLGKLFETWIRKPKLLLIDNVGIDTSFNEAKSTNFGRKLFLRVLEERTRIMGSITLFTTEFRDLSDWRGYALPSAISRLTGLCQTIGIFELKGEDRRIQL